MQEASLPDWIAAIGSLTTAVVAIFVFREAQKIRRGEIQHKIIEQWEYYNSRMLSSGFLRRWGDLYDCAFDEEKLTAEEKTVIWSTMNILMMTWTYSRDGILHDDYLRHHSVAWIWGLRKKKEFFKSFMEEYYMDPDFIRVMMNIMNCESLDYAKEEFHRIRKMKKHY